MLADTKPTRKTRPLIEYPRYFESDYCLECNAVHMVEKTHNGRILCHGERYYFEAIEARTHYARRLGAGFELVPCSTPAQMPIEWQLAHEPEYIQEW